MDSRHIGCLDKPPLGRFWEWVNTPSVEASTEAEQVEWIPPFTIMDDGNQTRPSTAWRGSRRGWTVRASRSDLFLERPVPPIRNARLNNREIIAFRCDT